MSVLYRGYYSGRGEWAGSTALYPTADEARAAARGCCYRGEHAWANAEYTGPLGAVLVAKAELRYGPYRNGKPSRVIEPGRRFRPGEVLLADPFASRVTIGAWLVNGEAAEVTPAAEQPVACHTDA